MSPSPDSGRRRLALRCRLGVHKWVPYGWEPGWPRPVWVIGPVVCYRCGKDHSGS